MKSKHSLKRNWKKFLRWTKKRRNIRSAPWIALTLISIGIFKIAPNFSFRDLSFNKNNGEILQQNNQIVNPSPENKPGTEEQGKIVGAEIVKDHFDLNDWVIDKKRLSLMRDDSICVRESEKYDSSEIWFTNKVPLGTEIGLRFILRAKDEVRHNQNLLFVAGKNTQERLFRIIVPENDRRFIGFENRAEPNIPYKLNGLLREMDVSRDININLKLDNYPKHTSDINFVYSLGYTPIAGGDNKTVKPIENDTDNFEATLPWSNPSGVGGGLYFGLGAFNGTCFNILSYSIIYPPER